MGVWNEVGHLSIEVSIDQNVNVSFEESESEPEGEDDLSLFDSDLGEEDAIYWRDADGYTHQSVYELVQDQVIIEGDISLGTEEEAWAEYE